MKVLYLLDNPEEVLPIMAYTGRLRPKGIPFFSGFRYIREPLWIAAYEREIFSLVETYERERKFVILVCKKGPKGLTDEFYGYKKSRKPFGFGNDSYLKDGAWRNPIGRLFKGSDYFKIIFVKSRLITGNYRKPFLNIMICQTGTCLRFQMYNRLSEFVWVYWTTLYNP